MKIRDYKSEDALVIPARIIQQDRKGSDYVYTYKSVEGVDRVEKLVLKIGQSYEEQIEVLEGLSAETMLIDKGAKSVQTGDAVELK